MLKEEIILRERLLYNNDENYIISQLKNINNSLMLHYFAANYNWNSGFDVPTAILENEACDFGTLQDLFLELIEERDSNN